MESKMVLGFLACTKVLVTVGTQVKQRSGEVWWILFRVFCIKCERYPCGEDLSQAIGSTQ